MFYKHIQAVYVCVKLYVILYLRCTKTCTTGGTLCLYQLPTILLFLFATNPPTPQPSRPVRHCLEKDNIFQQNTLAQGTGIIFWDFLSLKIIANVDVFDLISIIQI